MNPWIAIAEQVLKSAYDKADNSTLESIIIGLRTQTEETCVKAHQAILDLKKKKTKK